MIKNDVFQVVKKFFSSFPFVSISINYDVANDVLDVFFDDHIVPSCILRDFHKLEKYLDTHGYHCYLRPDKDSINLHIFSFHRFIDPD